MGTPPVVTQEVALTEQDSYNPRPAGQEGAPRLTARRLSVFLLTAPPPFSFWGAKKTTPAGVCRRQPTRSGGSWPEAKWGWIAAGHPRRPRLVNRITGGVRHLQMTKRGVFHNGNGEAF